MRSSSTPAMANGTDIAALEAAVAAAQEAVTRQGDIVRGLKAEVKYGKVVMVSPPSEVS